MKSRQLHSETTTQLKPSERQPSILPRIKSKGEFQISPRAGNARARPAVKSETPHRCQYGSTVTQECEERQKMAYIPVFSPVATFYCLMTAFYRVLLESYSKRSPISESIFENISVFDSIERSHLKIEKGLKNPARVSLDL